MSRRKPSYLSLTDLFCGAGGASQGAERAGLKLALGVNHWQRAVETHETNFPHAAHDCRDVSQTHPSRYGPTHILWASPECVTHSQARGKKRNSHGQMALDDAWEPLPSEAEERSRVTMWDVVYYAEYHSYEAVVVENVHEITYWSLLPSWYNAMERLGYAHRTLALNSMFFGVPQSRDRWYAVFWKRGNGEPRLDFTPASWCPRCETVVGGVQAWKPGRTAGRYRQQYVYACPLCASEALPYVQPAAVAIDWSVLGERIGDRKKALAAATMARIQAGIDRYWRPILLDTLRDPKTREVEVSPLPTQTTRQSLALVTHFRGTHESAIRSSSRSAEEPTGTITAGGIHQALVEPPEALYIKNYGAAEKAGPMAHPVSDPLGTITGQDHHALLVPARGPQAHRQNSARTTEEPLPTLVGETTEALVYVGRATNRARRATEPLPTLTTGGNMGLLSPPEPLVVPLDQRGPNRHNRSRSAEEPLRTQTTLQADGLLVPPGGTWRRDATSIDEPMPTRTSTENDGLLTSYYGRADTTRRTDEPMGTLTAERRHGLLVKAAGSTYDPGTYKRVRDAEAEPLWSQTSTAETGLIKPPEAFLATYHGQMGRPRPVREPMGTLTSRDRHALVAGASEIAIEDCHFRMLMPEEIKLGMAFEPDYVVTGNQSEKVRQCGQAVTPPVAEWILRRVVESLG